MTPTPETIALTRLTYGPTPEHRSEIQNQGLAAWLNRQLSAPTGDDPQTAEFLQNFRLNISYGPSMSGGEMMMGGAGVNEDRPLSTLTKSTEELWYLTDWGTDMPFQERVRPREEVFIATTIRAVKADYQLREVLVGFWHDHFHVNAMSDAIEVQVGLVQYDRDVIRKHAFGNFRELLEDVAKSPAMLAYLNNRSNIASPANENYARELFELHTLGADAYFNHLYSRWREVPGAEEGKPAGYIDQDVYEAARAFTGWTTESGNWDPRGNQPLPRTGRFRFMSSWHDPYQKRVLATEIEPNLPPLAAGQKVLDLVHNHPATWRHVCRKLCQKLVSDEPPITLVERAVETWRTHLDKPDQIAQTVRTIVLAPEFSRTWGRKLRRPFDSFVAFLRCTDLPHQFDQGTLWFQVLSGHVPFGWPTPDGAPESREAWIGAQSMMARWNAPPGLVYQSGDEGAQHLVDVVPASARTVGDAIGYWVDRLVPERAPKIVSHLIAATQGWIQPDEPFDREAHRDLIRFAVGVSATCPEFLEK